MARKNGKLVLCGFVIILALLQGSAAYECSSEALNPSFCSSVPSCPAIFFGSSDSPSRNSSTDLHPISFDGRLAPAFVLLDLALLIIYFPLLILFNINLASGHAQSFIFFYQVLPVAVPIDSVNPVNLNVFGGGVIWGPLTMQNPINDMFFPRILPYIALQYCRLASALVVAVMMVLLVKCVGCPCTSWRRPWAKLRRSVRHFREKHAYKGTVLNGLCSCAILTYGFVIQQSFSVLQPTQHCPNGTTLCAYYCTELNYAVLDTDYSPYLFVAVLFLVLVLPFPLLLLYYPCVPALMQHVTKRSPQFLTCHKLAPVLDVFQSAYKPKLRFFAALPLLYRFVIWLLFSALSAELTKSDRQLTITFALIVILAIHSLFQPYSNPKHNYIETLYLVNLVLISMTSILAIESITFDFKKFALIVVATVLIYLPMLAGVVYFLWRRQCCKWCWIVCCQKYCSKFRQNRKQASQDETEQVHVVISEVYLDASEVEQMNKD